MLLWCWSLIEVGEEKRFLKKSRVDDDGDHEEEEEEEKEEEEEIWGVLFFTPVMRPCRKRVCSN